jgi:aminoglycoside 3-N-acetyltransferase
MHFAEKLAGRKQFTRWALTPSGTIECPGFPGCSAGFQAIEPDMRSFTRSITLGDALVQAVPLRPLMVKVIEAIKKDKYALLCDRADCERCAEVRKT